MTNLQKTLVTGGAIGVLVVGGFIFSASSTPSEAPVSLEKTPIEAKIGKDSDLRKKAKPEVQAVMDKVIEWDEKKKKGEITGREQEILDLETQVDETRRENDTPELQKLDRMLETMDAGNVFYDTEKQKLLDL
jgi:hypothetical protein